MIYPNRLSTQLNQHLLFLLRDSRTQRLVGYQAMGTATGEEKRKKLVDVRWDGP